MGNRSTGADDGEFAEVVMQHVLEVMDGPFVWGQSDCCTSACEVFRRLHGVDPMAPLRGRYASEQGAEAAILAWGGWLRMTARLARLAGLQRGVGEAGELGLIRQGNGFVLAVGLGRNTWAGRIDGGFETARGAVRSWRK